MPLRHSVLDSVVLVGRGWDGLMTAWLTEDDIRPADLFAAYLELVGLDVDAYFADTDRRPIACPACDNAGEPVFAKLGFDFRE